MNILVLRPPQVLSYFNAGHHLALYQVAAALEARFACGIYTLDASVETVTWKDFADLLFQRQFDYILLMNDLDGTDGFPRAIKYVRELSPTARIVTFGRFSGIRPEYFHTLNLDAVIRSGDYEAVCGDVVEHFLSGEPRDVPGVDLWNGQSWSTSSQFGRTIEPDEWILPRPAAIPYEMYDRLYSKESRKFSGLPGKRELVIPVARGCPIGCSFCEVPVAFGRVDRRMSVSRVIEYIADCFAEAPFEYVSFYAPTFTISRAWVLELVTALAQAPRKIEWKCCTTVHHLDEELVSLMASVGCVRISVGVESLDKAAANSLPRVKRNTGEHVTDLAAWCGAVGIELNCFVIVGLPGTTVTGIQDTIDTLTTLGARVRPTVFTPYEEIAESDSPTRVMDFNRQLLNFSDFESNAERAQAYNLLCN